MYKLWIFSFCCWIAIFNDNINKLEDLNNHPLILQKKESNSRKFLDAFCLNNNVKLNAKTEIVSQELVTEFVNSGMGIGFTLIDLAKRNYPNLKELKINNKLPKVNVYVATNKNINLTFAAKTFLQDLKKVLEK